MCLLVLVEVILFGGNILWGGVLAELDQNAREIVDGKVENRKGYLENEMVNNWSNVGPTVDQINRKTAQLQASGVINVHTLGQDSASCEPLLAEIAGNLISMMRSNRVTGAFVIFNNDSPEELQSGICKDKPGIYLRDQDPLSGTSINNSDLLIERAPTGIVQALNIPTDQLWRPQFEFESQSVAYYPFFTEAYEQGCLHPDAKSVREVGYWSSTYSLNRDHKKNISYTVPLIAEDGTVYGVLGVELSREYINTLLPSNELMGDGKGSYLLAIEDGKDHVFQNVFMTGDTYAEENYHSGMTTMFKEEGNYKIKGKKTGKEYYGTTQYLHLYDNNASFEHQRWALIGIVDEKNISAVSGHIKRSVFYAVIVTLILGIGGSIFISIKISNPIRMLARDIYNTNAKEKIKLKRTKIEEIDRLEISIEKLSSDVIDSAMKFSEILEHASVRIAGFEMDEEKQTLFITEEFFDIFGEPDVDVKTLSMDDFKDEIEALSIYKQEQSEADTMLYKVPKGNEFVYIKLSYSYQGARCIGLIEDVTDTVKERKVIEHERDHDPLTGLENRRSFQRKMEHLFVQGAPTLKKAALLMLDLDNLKAINDTYGHDYGDKYIKQAAESIQKYVPENAVVARISGDEFRVFFYGYQTEDEIRGIVAKTKREVDEEKLVLPTSKTCKIQISGGISWYPRDSVEYEDLQKYSDFAMYQVKRTTKGAVKEFCIQDYHGEEYLERSKQELLELLQFHRVEYYFQPIVNVKTGEIFAYEALMRGNMPTLHSPDEILSLASKEKKLEQIEEMTWLKASEAYANHISMGQINQECKLFINSLSNYAVSEKTLQNIERKYPECVHHYVIELTEEGEQNPEALKIKQESAKRLGWEFALDDYGSGYNSERTLLNIKPSYVKLDRSLITGISCDENRQQMIGHIISYAHERKMDVIAEGIETKEDAAMIITLGGDYLQGYYIARPSLEPPMISEMVKCELRNMSKHQNTIRGEKVNK